MLIKSNLLDAINKNIYPAEILIEDKKIKSIKKIDEVLDNYILPGFIDAHIHIESSMLIPSAFAQKAVIHGTVATVSDPHEIANVLGIEGVNFMINNAAKVPFNFFFGAPSCVPATQFETAGAEINPDGIEQLLSRTEILYLSEMMNYPGVIYKDDMVMEKIAIAKKYNKPIDGHAPGLRGDDLIKYQTAGISTDHECFTLDEALEKIALGMKIIIREGSAARNFEALHPLINKFPDQIMFCSDDKHPDELVNGHINLLIKRALNLGYSIYDLIKIACINPVLHYNLPVGILREGDYADFIIVNNLTDFDIQETYIKGNQVALNGLSFIPEISETPINNFSIKPLREDDFRQASLPGQKRIIVALDGELITKEEHEFIPCGDGILHSIIEKDILLIAVVNRYKISKISIGLIKNFGLKQGAIASSVAHDSHNIIAIGVTPKDLQLAVNAVIKHRGGVSVYNPELNETRVLPLPVAGLMSILSADEVARTYSQLDLAAKQLGSPLRAPFMSLSFMGLLVIPQLKMSDLGLFDANTFSLCSIDKS